jgi:light-independent protochlorophyllide reductase subunit B
MKLTVWTYEGPPHVGAMRVATGMKGLHYVLHAPQGDTYADLLFTMIERRNHRPPVTYTTFEGRDLGEDTAGIFKKTCQDAYDRFKPQALIVGASCTAELIQDDPGGLAETMGIPVPVVALELPSYQRKENFGTDETFYQLVRALARPMEKTPEVTANLIGPLALGFRHRDDIEEVKGLLYEMGIGINVVAPFDATPEDLTRLGQAHVNVLMYPEHAETAARHMERVLGIPTPRPCRSASAPPMISSPKWPESAACGAEKGPLPPAPALVVEIGRLHVSHRQARLPVRRRHPCESRRAHRPGRDGVRGGGPWLLQPRIRALHPRAWPEFGVEPLITDDYLEVEKAIEDAAPEMILGTQMERHIGKRLGIPCAVISAPVHVQDFPARYSPQMGWEGANVIFDTWIHPLVMGLEEHLLAMFREDFEFHDEAGPSHHGGHAPKPVGAEPDAAGARGRGCSRRAYFRKDEGSGWCRGTGFRLRRDGLAGRCRARTQEDPVLRARQGAPQHRGLCRRTRCFRDQHRHPLRSEGPFCAVMEIISPATGS